MKTKNEVDANAAAVAYDISRSIRQSARFIGASVVVGALVLGASITSGHNVSVTLFVIAGLVVALWSVYLILKFILYFMATRKRTRENRRMEQILSGRMAVSKTGVNSP